MFHFDQIERCLSWVDNFQVYQKREVILAFKFLSKKRIGTAKYEKRELHEFYKVWDKKKKPIDCVCTYDGKTYALKKWQAKKTSAKRFHNAIQVKIPIILYLNKNFQSFFSNKFLNIIWILNDILEK